MNQDNLYTKTVRWFEQRFPGKGHALTFACVGCACALFIRFVGFWPTMFMLLCVFIGYAFGQTLDGKPTIIKTLKRRIRQLMIHINGNDASGRDFFYDRSDKHPKD